MQVENDERINVIPSSAISLAISLIRSILFDFTIHMSLIYFSAVTNISMSFIMNLRFHLINGYKLRRGRQGARDCGYNEYISTGKRLGPIISRKHQIV